MQFACEKKIDIRDYEKLPENTVLVGVPNKLGTGIDYVVLHEIDKINEHFPADYYMKVVGKNTGVWSKIGEGVESVEGFDWKEEKVPCYDSWYNATVTKPTKSKKLVRMLTGSLGRDIKVRLLYEIYDRPAEEQFRVVLEGRLGTYSTEELVKWYLSNELKDSATVKDVRLEGAYMVVEFEEIKNQQHTNLVMKHIRGIAK